MVLNTSVYYTSYAIYHMRSRGCIGYKTRAESDELQHLAPVLYIVLLCDSFASVSIVVLLVKFLETEMTLK